MNLHSDKVTPSNRPLEGTRILLVEDEVIIAMDLRMSLEEAGAIVTHAARQSTATSLATERDFDAAILDVNLGRNATCQPIAEALRERGVPFLLHTGDLQDSGELVQRIGAPIAQKPMSSDDLIVMLFDLLA